MKYLKINEPNFEFKMILYRKKKSSLKGKLDRVFSQYIRLRDMLPNTTAFKCISCGSILPIYKADCGHYINRQHMSTRYSEINCNAQCKKCNRFDEGNMSGYRNGLVEKYGMNKVVFLESQKNEFRRYEKYEYEALIEHYKAEIKKELERRNLTIKCLSE